MDTFFFYAFAALTLGGAIFTVTRRSPVHCALALAVSLMGVAGLFLMSGAEFLFAVQIVLYIGGVVVLFLFVIMLVNLDEAARQRKYKRNWLLGLSCVLLVGVQIVYFLSLGARAFPVAAAGAGAQAAADSGHVEALADVLFSEFLLPFELASVLLLAAIVGAVILARKKA
jgi:NADH-quinone oxidoreductase subunit J